MGRAGGMKVPPPKYGGAQINGVCAECRKKKTLCINVRSRAYATDPGHVALTLGDGSNFETFGNWPAKYSAGGPMRVERNGRAYSKVPESTVKQGFDDVSKPEAPATDNPENDRRFKKRKCKEIDEKQEQQLRELAKRQSYQLLGNNCATWATGTWNAVTGDALSAGTGVSIPATLEGNL